MTKFQGKCNDLDVYGAQKSIKFDKLKKSFSNLPFHYLIRILFTFYGIDGWDSELDQISLQIDQNQIPLSICSDNFQLT